jgi:cold shock CspA family protein
VFRVGQLSGAFSFSGESMRGQITFFDSKKQFGIIVAEVSGEQHFFSGHDLAEPIKRNDWVVFDSEPNQILDSTSDWQAKNVCRIECPPEFLLYGLIHSFFPEKHFGFINYETNGRTESIFFHCSDLLRIDGVEPVPFIGCQVSFCIGQKTDRSIAAQIWIERRPDFEEHFAAADELPLEEPLPVAALQSSVLSPATRNLTLLEIRQRRKGIQK